MGNVSQCLNALSLNSSSHSGSPFHFRYVSYHILVKARRNYVGFYIAGKAILIFRFGGFLYKLVIAGGGFTYYLFHV